MSAAGRWDRAGLHRQEGRPDRHARVLLRLRARVFAAGAVIVTHEPSRALAGAVGPGWDAYLRADLPADLPRDLPAFFFALVSEYDGASGSDSYDR